MTSEEKQSAGSEEPSAMHFWGPLLANCFWIVTLLMVLAFFWQSFGEMLAN